VLESAKAKIKGQDQKKEETSNEASTIAKLGPAFHVRFGKAKRIVSMKSQKGQTKDSFLMPESRVAAQLGLTRVMCAALRRDKLKPQVDYVIERRRVMITNAGYVALRGLLGYPESPEDEKARQSQSMQEPQPIPLVITSLRPPKNPHIIEVVRKDDGGEPLRVRVRNNRNFMPGMEIRARQDENYPDVFVLVGRTPRYRGRW
jgi:hypothetical protein